MDVSLGPDADVMSVLCEVGNHYVSPEDILYEGGDVNAEARPSYCWDCWHEWTRKGY